MTTDQPGSVDLDLLADYAGGALDGTPDQARVAALVETDPRWARALAQLRDADALVRSDLATLGAVEPMPADVASRLDRALQAAGDTTPAPVTSLVARRWRRTRMIATGAVAAGLIAIASMAGYSVLGLNGSGGESGTAADHAESRADSPGAAEVAPGNEQDRNGDSSGAKAAYPVPVIASGTDYTRKDLSGVRAQRYAGSGATIAPPAGLERLAAPAALRDCLAAVDAVYPGTASMADYARFEGAPAVIIAITMNAGGDQVVVVGAECGRDGTDEKYHTGV